MPVEQQRREIESGASRNSLVGPGLVFPICAIFRKKAIQGSATNPEDFRSLSLVVVDEQENALDMASLDFFERTEIRVPVAHAGVLVAHRIGKVSNIDGVSLRHHAGMGEDIFELSYISRPGMPSQ
jgi:hypothetical protein